MPATTSKLDIQRFIDDFPDIQFQPADTFCWAAQKTTVLYVPELLKKPRGLQQLLHEIGHAISGHTSFTSGVELLRMETEAWEAARSLAKKYKIIIKKSHIEYCLDSYRDWLHVRSTCPNCQAIASETEPCQYRCFNCLHNWRVSPDQRTRCYRRTLVRSE